MFTNIKITTMQKSGIFILFMIVGLSGCFHSGGEDNGGDGFDVQVQAIEVTQGVRQDIPVRIPPNALNILAEDVSFRNSGSHVAGRRTIVRVYPWIQVNSGPTAQTLSASLYGFARDGIELPGSPLSPQNVTLIPDAAVQSLSGLRKEAARSWNFVLPDSWTVTGEIRLKAVANPLGTQFVAECEGCGDNNSVTLLGTRFTMETNQASFIPYILNWANVASDGTVTWTEPSSAEVASTLSYLYKTWPIPEMNYFGTFYVDTCIPDGIECIDPYTGTNNTVPVSPQDQQRAKIAELGLVNGGFTMVPAIIDTESINHVGERMGCRGHAGVSGPPDYWQTACGSVFAHESAHAGPGRTHAGGFHGSVGGVDLDYPDPSGHGAVEANTYGFDIFAMQAIPPVDSRGRHTHDYMSYGSDSDFKWTSFYTWNGLRTWLNGSAAASIMQRTPPVGLRSGAQTKTVAKPPQLLLLNPRNGDTVNPEQDIALMGQAFDHLDGQLPGEQLVWQVDGRIVGHGTRVTISGLSEGQHLISLQAKNSNGLQSIMSVTVSVAPDSDFDGLPNEWETKYGFDPLTPNASEDPDGDGVVNWREFVAGTNPLDPYSMLENQ